MRNYNIDEGVLLKYCGNAVHLSIPKDVTEIYAWAFYCCDTITSIEIPNSVTKIGQNAFRDCRNLTSIKLPNSVTKIGCYAFCGCDNLASIQIPDSIKYIGDTAFDVMDVKPQYNINGTLRAFKAFNKDWTCRGFKYEVGKSYHQDGKIFCCSNGFHACTNPLDVFNYYCGNLNTLRFAEVELSGEMDFEGKDSKVAASDIRIIRELTISELFDIYNKMEKC
jgi:hypothetical protein